MHIIRKTKKIKYSGIDLVDFFIDLPILVIREYVKLLCKNHL